MEVQPALVVLQRLAQGADTLARVLSAEPASGVQRPKLGEGEVCHATLSVSRPVHCVVVDNNDMVVTGQMDIEFNVVDAHCQRLVIGSEGVLRCVG